MDKLLPWFVLKSVPGIGNYLFKLLLDRFDTPEKVFNSSLEELLSIEGIHRRLAFSILHHKVPRQVKNDLKLAIKKGYSVVTLSDPLYPYLLRQIYDPPPFLYVFGTLDGSEKNISVVGSRNSTSYGMVATRRLCSDLASRGITIVSGMAKGIDAAAHTGALSAKGRTIAVLGSGLEKIYPKENKNLYYKIAENGAVISEFPLLEEPEAYNFPRRNRIISGMSFGTVVVEAAKKSGSLITARLAVEQNREVFAVPGNIHSFKSTGTHNLIKQGAKLVENADDVLEELSNVIKPRKESGSKENIVPEISINLTSEEKEVFDTLDFDPVHIDDLVRNISFDAGKLLSILMRLELKGMVEQLPGKFFFLKEK